MRLLTSYGTWKNILNSRSVVARDDFIPGVQGPIDQGLSFAVCLEPDIFVLL